MGLHATIYIPCYVSSDKKERKSVAEKKQVKLSSNKLNG
jgi:hypothetical protein